MKIVTVEYRRWFRTVRRELHLPERWSELTSRQFIAAVQLWTGKIALSSFLLEVFGFKWFELNRMDEYQRWVLLHSTDWMRTLTAPHNMFFLQRLPGTKLLSPGPRLKGCSLQQFMTADTFFSQYLVAVAQQPTRQGVAGNNGAEMYLNQFIAALYKRENEVFSRSESNTPARANLIVLEDHLKEVRPLGDDIKQAIVMNYVLIKSWLCKAFPHLFLESESDNRPSNRPRTPKATDWLAIFDNFVGDHVADMEKYQAMQATDAFRVMNRRIREAKKRAAASL